MPRPLYPPPPRKNPVADLIGGWMGNSAGLDGLKRREISCHCRKSNRISLVVQPVPVVTGLTELSWPLETWRRVVKTAVILGLRVRISREARMVVRGVVPYIRNKMLQVLWPGLRLFEDRRRFCCRTRLRADICNSRRKFP